MKTVSGAILLIVGLIGTLITGINAIKQTETLSFLDMDIVVAKGDYTPVIFSVIILVLGVLLLTVPKGR